MNTLATWKLSYADYFNPQYDATANKIEYVTNGTGSLGVVSLAFNTDKTRLVGTS